MRKKQPNIVKKSDLSNESTVEITVNNLANAISALSGILNDQSVLLSFHNAIKLTRYVSKIEECWASVKKVTDKHVEDANQKKLLIDQDELDDKEERKSVVDSELDKLMKDLGETMVSVPVIDSGIFKTNNNTDINISPGLIYSLRQILI